MRKREGTKEKDILDAAIKIFAQYGYHKAKIASIAEVAGVATEVFIFITRTRKAFFYLSLIISGMN